MKDQNIDNYKYSKLSSFKFKNRLFLVSAISIAALFMGCSKGDKGISSVNADNSRVEVVASIDSKEASDEDSSSEVLFEVKEDAEAGTSIEEDSADIEKENKVTSEEVSKDSKELDIQKEVLEVEKQSDKLMKKLRNEDLNQLQMNYIAHDIYLLWDDEINKVWGYLKDSLDKEAMDELTSLQREWIAKKEKEVLDAGSEYEGGSIRPMIEHLKGAEITRERVYELIELLD